eukprot:207327_1
MKKQHHPCPPENFMLTLLNDNPHHHTQHLISLLVAKVDVIIGTNGFIWITRTGGVICTTTSKSDGWGGNAEEIMSQDAESIERRRKEHNSSPILGDDRIRICRVRNSIVVLRMANTIITPESILHVYNRSIEAKLPPSQMLDSKAMTMLMSDHNTAS